MYKESYVHEHVAVTEEQFWHDVPTEFDLYIWTFLHNVSYLMREYWTNLYITYT